MDFVDWLSEEIERRGWSNNELGRRAGVSSGTVSLVMTKKNLPTWEFCASVAEAFNVPPETVMRKAGLLRPTQNMDDIQRLVDAARNLPKDELDEVVDYTTYRYERHKLKEKRARYDTD